MSGLTRAVMSAVLLIAASCGGEDRPSPAKQPPPPVSGDGGLILSVDHPAPLASGSEVGWTLTLRNDGPAVTLEFPSGQDGDVVLTQDNVERYRWSRGRAFTQAFRQLALGAGEVRTFQLAPKTLDVPPGAYQLVGSLNAHPAPPKASETVRVV